MHQVDDTKPSCMNPLVVENLLNLLESNFRKLKTVTGKHHEFLGMTITFQDDGCFHTIMGCYLENKVEEFDETLLKEETPARPDLLHVDNKKQC